MAEAASATKEAEVPTSGDVGLSRSVARALGRAARWAVNEAEVFTGSAKQVLAVGGRATTWVTGVGGSESADTSELLKQLQEFVSNKGADELDTLEGDPEFWRLVRRLQRSQRGRWPWSRVKTEAVRAEAATSGPLLAENGAVEAAIKGGENSQEANAEAAPPGASDASGSETAQQDPAAADAESEADAGKAETAEKGKRGKKDA